MSKRRQYSEFIKAEALRLGFFACGLSKARYLEEEVQSYEEWLKNDFHASMAYMENHFDKRLDPRLLVPGAKTMVSVLMNYYPGKSTMEDEHPVVSKYALGEDYHAVIKERLQLLLARIRYFAGDVSGRVFTDSAPVLEKKWAELSGVAWRGKHSGMLTKKGSFFFIGEIIIDLETDYDEESLSYCGTCTKCIDACPTGAIIKPYVIDARKCISYQTIEHKGPIPENLKASFKNRLFGCDICQDVCPYNKKSVITRESVFLSKNGLGEMTFAEWDEMDLNRFKAEFKTSALMRTGYSGIKRNLDFLKS